MEYLLKFIKTRFSGYTLLLILISAIILIFSDRKQLKQAGLNKEAGFSMGAGIVYIAIVVFIMILGFFMPLE